MNSRQGESFLTNRFKLIFQSLPSSCDKIVVVIDCLHQLAHAIADCVSHSGSQVRSNVHRQNPFANIRHIKPIDLNILLRFGEGKAKACLAKVCHLENRKVEKLSLTRNVAITHVLLKLL